MNTVPRGLVIGQRLKAARDRRLLTQEELAERSGVHFTTISKIENGGTARQSTVRRLAAALGVDPSELVEGAD
jgi:transcriptional regulator with XRE-family HTH domain